MYKVFILPRAQKDLRTLSVKIFTQIKKKIFELKNNPRPSNSIKLTVEEGYRLRAGDYRILYRISDKDHIVFIYRIKHRKDVYK